MPLRLKLPLIFGCVSMALNGWDFYNEIVIERTGRTWDTGAPIWPYQVPHLLLVALNAPAWEASVVFDRALGSYSPPRFAGEFFVLTLMLWWFVGLELDCVRTGATARRTGMLATLGFASVAVLAFVWARSSVPTDLRVVGQFVWALCIGSWAALWAGTCWRRGCVLTLPITMGRVSLLLLVWSLRNERVIEHMGHGLGHRGAGVALHDPAVPAGGVECSGVLGGGMGPTRDGLFDPVGV